MLWSDVIAKLHISLNRMFRKEMIVAEIDWFWFWQQQLGAHRRLQHRVDLRAGLEGGQRCQGHRRLHWAALSNLQVWWTNRDTLKERWLRDFWDRIERDIRLAQIVTLASHHQRVPRREEAHSTSLCVGWGEICHFYTFHFHDNWLTSSSAFISEFIAKPYLSSIFAESAFLFIVFGIFLQSVGQ